MPSRIPRRGRRGVLIKPVGNTRSCVFSLWRRRQAQRSTFKAAEFPAGWSTKAARMMMQAMMVNGMLVNGTAMHIISHATVTVRTPNDVDGIAVLGPQTKPYIPKDAEGGVDAVTILTQWVIDELRDGTNRHNWTKTMVRIVLVMLEHAEGGVGAVSPPHGEVVEGDVPARRAHDDMRSDNRNTDGNGEGVSMLQCRLS